MGNNLLWKHALFGKKWEKVSILGKMSLYRLFFFFINSQIKFLTISKMLQFFNSILMIFF